METSLNSDDLVDRGEAHHKAGQLQEAESYYRKALEVDPTHPGALYFLASIAYDDQRLELSAQLIERLLKDEPSDAEAWHLLGMISLKADNLDRAEECIKKALSLQPSYVQAHYGLGDILSRKNDLTSALVSFQKAVTLNPNYFEAHFAIGNICKLQNDADAAITSFKKVVVLKPDMELAYLSIGQLLGGKREFDEAITLYQQAIKHLPKSAKIYNDLGNTFVQLKRFSDAAFCLEKAISIDPELVPPYDNLGNLLLDLGRIEEGLARLKQAVTLDPNCPRTNLNVAGGLARLGNQAEAVPWIRKALAIDPTDAESHSFLLCVLQYLADYPQEKSFQDHVEFGERFEAPFKEKWVKRRDESRSLKKRLRIAFVSGDLRQHPVGHFLEGVLLQLYQKNAFDIYVYDTDSDDEDVLTHRLRDSAHVWVTVKDLSDEAFADHIQTHQIDILIDLSGHTPGNRLLVFARKPAPIQVTWLGYWDTTGLRSIDYLLCDPYSVQKGEEHFFVEQPWPLPHTRLCFTPPRDNVPVASLPALTEGVITFGCFNNLSKVTDQVVGVWAKIMQRVPRSRLFLKWLTLNDSLVRNSISERFSKHGISSDRLIMEGASPRVEYLTAYNRVDFALDPFPFSGGTTSFEGIWMGVPMVTLKGDRIIARQGECILQNIDLQDWIADNENDYVELAVRKAQSLESLANLRAQLRQRIESSTLCDAQLFARNLEAAFESMWERYCASLTATV